MEAGIADHIWSIEEIVNTVDTLMDDKDRVVGFLELARLNLQRFRELEDIEWRINFSAWAFVGAIGYLWVTAKLPADWLFEPPYPFVIAPVIVALTHGISLYKVNRQMDEQRLFRERWRSNAEELLGVSVRAGVPRRYWGLRRSDWSWIVWEVLVTVLLLGAALLMITKIRRPPDLQL